jgi:hypothetical protein
MQPSGFVTALGAVAYAVVPPVADPWPPDTVFAAYRVVDLASLSDRVVTVSYSEQTDGSTYLVPWTFSGSGFAFDGRYIFHAFGFEPVTPLPDLKQVVAYDLDTNSMFTVLRAPYWTLVAGDGTVAWAQGSNPVSIHAIVVTDAFPAARVPDDRAPNRAYSYHPETGHYLQFGFRAYWVDNGGLPVFGYPLTEEYRELNQDTGAWYTVQFTERQRFEWHPEYAGTPYEVLLGRLGFEQAAQAGLLDDEPFRFRGDDEGPDAGCTYYRETGHYACDAFVFYWREYGLDLGDPGISYRESLALFGYAISEPFTTTNADGDTVYTQYFERAVFELHPENPLEYRVLLRRLGAEALVERGWLP